MKQDDVSSAEDGRRANKRRYKCDRRSNNRFGLNDWHTALALRNLPNGAAYVFFTNSISRRALPLKAQKEHQQTPFGYVYKILSKKPRQPLRTMEQAVPKRVTACFRMQDWQFQSAKRAGSQRTGSQGFAQTGRKSDLFLQMNARNLPKMKPLPETTGKAWPGNTNKMFGKLQGLHAGSTESFWALMRFGLNHTHRHASYSQRALTRNNYQ